MFWHNKVYNGLHKTHQQAFISAEHSVSKGRAGAVVTGHKASVQTPWPSHYLQHNEEKEINKLQVK